MSPSADGCGSRTVKKPAAVSREQTDNLHPNAPSSGQRAGGASGVAFPPLDRSEALRNSTTEDTVVGDEEEGRRKGGHPGPVGGGDVGQREADGDKSGCSIA